MMDNHFDTDAFFRKVDSGEAEFTQYYRANGPSVRPVIYDAGLDDEPVPPRGWLLGNSFCRKFISALLGGGGAGKTALRIAQALAMATGRNLTGEHVFLRCRVLFLCLEDDIAEVRRRVNAALKHYGKTHGITKADLVGWLFYAAPGRAAGKLLERDANGQLKPGFMCEWLVDDIERFKIDCVILDPLIKAHGASENSNDEMDAVSNVIAGIVHQHDIAFDTPHHIRKGTAEAGNADQGRGAGATKDGGRLVYTLTVMNPEEAKLFGVDANERRAYVRLDSGKVNICPATKATWFKLIGVPLGNGTDLYPNGDEVQVAVSWVPPDLFAGISPKLANEILDKIETGFDGRRYTNATQAEERAAWRLVQEHAPILNEKQCQEVIKAWIKSTVIVSRKYHDPIDRREVFGLFLNPATPRPGSTL
jgi:hypothetical protein